MGVDQGSRNEKCVQPIDITQTQTAYQIEKKNSKRNLLYQAIGKKNKQTNTHLLCIHSASDVVKYGSIKYNENMCECCLFSLSLNISIQLNSMMDDAITIDWPTSNPLMPANMLMAFVQNTANIPMNT